MINRLLVIADDLTGAAEIAGIGLRYGLAPRLRREAPGRVDAGLTVLDTDTRLSGAADAVAVLTRRAHELAVADPSGFPHAIDLIFKKTDSVLRGPTLAEVEALMRALKRPAALLVPQNPSRGRLIDEFGQYHMDGVPLYASSFANDPEYPATTSDVLEILRHHSAGAPAAKAPGPPARIADVGAPLPAAGVVVGAGGAEQVRRWAARVRPGVAGANVLAAGAADFFQAILEHQGHSVRRRSLTGMPPGPTLFVCGSASAYSRNELVARAEHKGVPVLPMPEPLYHDTAGGTAQLAKWVAAATKAIADTGRALMTINQPPDRAPGKPQRLQDAISDAAAKVLAEAKVANLMLEGGATGSVVCRRMGWSNFDVTGEFGTGIVQLRVAGHADTPHIVVKPGSYRWPDVVWDVSAPAAAKR